MTTPNERTRALVTTGDFLRKIEQDETLSAGLREMANQLLRHYPTRGEILVQAQIESNSHSPFLGLAYKL